MRENLRTNGLVDERCFMYLTRYLHVSAGGLHGMHLDDAWYGNLPSFWNQRPSSSKIDLEIPYNVTTISAYPSFCYDEEQLFC